MPNLYSNISKVHTSGFLSNSYLHNLVVEFIKESEQMTRKRDVLKQWLTTTAEVWNFM